MSASPLVSCIMPTKNRKQFVCRAFMMFIDAARIALSKCELIVLEDGEDSCSDFVLGGNIVAKKKDLNWRVRYRRHEGTLGAKLNEGARLARGKYLVNWDDDDFHHPQRIANIVKHFELTGAQMVGMSSMPYWREGEKDVWIFNSSDPRYCTGSGQAFRRDWVLANPHLDQTVAEDEYMCRMAAKQGVLSTIGGTDWVVACSHGAHCTNRNHPMQAAPDSDEAKLEAIFGRPADNWQRSSIEKFSWVQQWALQASA